MGNFKAWRGIFQKKLESGLNRILKCGILEMDARKQKNKRDREDEEP